MSLVISDEVLQTIQMSESELLTEIAILLFEQERFTLGQASRFAKISCHAFKLGISSDQDGRY
jgi:predicted HTH domain antitoxin